MLDAFPFVKFQSTDDMNDATVQVKKKYAVFDMNKKRLEKKERIKYLTDFQVTSPPEKISLKDFLTRKCVCCVLIPQSTFNVRSACLADCE